MRKIFKAGELVFAEGDPSEQVIRIAAGTVDVLRDIGDETILLGTVGIGEFLGEMGVIEQQPRSATARAATEVEAEILSPEAFFQEVSTSPTTALGLIQRLSARLRDVSNQFIGAVKSDGELAALVTGIATVAAPGATPRPMEIAASSPELTAQIGAAPLPLTDLPYIVGRRTLKDEQGPGVPLDLEIAETPPHRLSLAHFIVLEEYGKPVVRDLASGLGTMINGRSIGRDFQLDVAPLHDGENEVVAGGVDSPFRFAIRVG